MKQIQDYRFILAVALSFAIICGMILGVWYRHVSSKIFFRDVSAFRALADMDKLRILREMGATEGPQAVYDFLKRTYPDEPGSEHELAHIVGEAAFDKMGYAGFDICDSFMRYGCYHGVILKAIRVNGYSKEVLQNLAKSCLDLKRNRTTILSCIHGIGHGLMWVKSYDLLASFKTCDQMFGDPEQLFFCYDGVSMENVVRRGEQTGAKDYLTSKDPFYPCDSVSEKYQSACVREHVFQARRVFYHNDTAETATYCLHFPTGGVREECFAALGNTVQQEFSADPKKVVQECERVGSWSAPCIMRAATQYAYSRQADAATLLCSSIGDSNRRGGCFGAVRFAQSSL